MTKEFTYCEDTYSDLYKEVNGFRPRNTRFFDATPEEKQRIWDSLLEDLDVENQRIQEAEQENIADFEKLVQQNIELGAGDRKTAIQWLIDAEDDVYVEGDLDYFRFLYGLPYNYQL